MRSISHRKWGRSGGSSSSSSSSNTKRQSSLSSWHQQQQQQQSTQSGSPLQRPLVPWEHFNTTNKPQHDKNNYNNEGDDNNNDEDEIKVKSFSSGSSCCVRIHGLIQCLLLAAVFGFCCHVFLSSLLLNKTKKKLPSTLLLKKEPLSYSNLLKGDLLATTAAATTKTNDAIEVSVSKQGKDERERQLDSINPADNTVANDGHLVAPSRRRRRRRRYPIGDRTLVLSNQALCAAAIQPEPWTPGLPADLASRQQNSFLHVNPDCPDAARRMKDIMAMSRNSSTEVQAEAAPFPQITLALLYYQDLQLLSRHLYTWCIEWPPSVRQHYQFLIIDDGSQVGWRAMDFVFYHFHKLKDEQCGLLLQKTTHSSLTIYEVEQDLPFNIGGARNLAHAVVTNTDYVLTTDADVYINATVAKFLVSTLKQDQSTKRGQTTPEKLRLWKFFRQLMPDKITMEPHPAVMLTSQRAYWTLGGCDEDLVGHYGQTDILFLYKADHDAAIQVTSLLPAMGRRNIYVKKWWRHEKNTCHPQFPCPDQSTWPMKFRPPQPRVIQPNLQLLAHKKQGKQPFSNTFLRFGWHKVTLLPL